MEPRVPPTPPDARRTANRGRVVRRAFFKPLNVLTLVAGLGLFFVSGIFWVLPLTLVVYAAVVYLAAKDPLFVQRVENPRVNALPSRDVSPERRARWLSRDETREKVEAALVTYRKVILAIEESDEVALRVLEGAVPRLHEAADRLVDVASNRERAVKTLADFETSEKTGETDPDGQRAQSLGVLREHVRQADREIDDISTRFMTLRVQVVRASMDSAGAKQQAEAINSSLDSLNYRLEALNETFSGEEPA